MSFLKCSIIIIKLMSWNIKLLWIGFSKIRMSWSMILCSCTALDVETSQCVQPALVKNWSNLVFWSEERCFGRRDFTGYPLRLSAVFWEAREQGSHHHSNKTEMMYTLPLVLQSLWWDILVAWVKASYRSAAGDRHTQTLTHLNSKSYNG